MNLVLQTCGTTVFCVRWRSSVLLSNYHGLSFIIIHNGTSSITIKFDSLQTHFWFKYLGEMNFSYNTWKMCVCVHVLADKGTASVCLTYLVQHTKLRLNGFHLLMVWVPVFWTNGASQWWWRWGRWGWFHLQFKSCISPPSWASRVK